MPPGFPSGMRHFGPPIEIFATELVYVLLVIAISAYIYFKTKEIYDLSKHKGIYFFRNVFLYFSLAYFFRLLMMGFMFSRELFSLAPTILMQLFSLFFVSYFSTMAILSVVVSINIRKTKTDPKKLNIVLNAIALLISFIIGFSRSNILLMFLQTGIFLIAIIILLFKTKKNKHEKHSKLISQNKITFVLLFLFWVMSTLAFVRGLVPREVKIPLYLLSAGIFFSIFLRVRKKLKRG
ncbi:MAG: hypothetical protein KKF44_06975 [Nanoarchaeota archaeon]|nr:hypothetical protein [Nanoarchaeota archaeon]